MELKEEGYKGVAVKKNREREIGGWGILGMQRHREEREKKMDEGGGG